MTVKTDTSLLFYYKLNEGWSGSVGQMTLDYSGRKNDGIINNFTSTTRQTASAIDTSGLSPSPEPVDVVWVPSTNYASYSSELTDYYNTKIASAVSYDELNEHSLYNKFPTWLLEAEQSNGTEHLKTTVQIIAAYIDDLYLKIGEISKYKHGQISTDKDNLYPFYDKILTSTGFDVTELFSNLDIIQKLSSRDDEMIYSENLSKIKNAIYQNIYNNLSYVLKSKGTEKSLKSFLRAYGVDENLVKINLYADKSLFNISDKSSERVIKKKTVTLTGSQNITSSLIDVGSDKTYTAEVQLLLPSNYTSLSEISVLKSDTVSVYLKNVSSGSLFVMSSSGGTSQTAIVDRINLQDAWNVVLRADGTTTHLDAISYDTNDYYTHLTSSLSNANSQNISITVGSADLRSTNIRLTDVTLWSEYLSDSDILKHASDITNYGITHDISQYNVVSAYDNCLLLWDFEHLTSSGGSGNFIVLDTIGSNNGTGTGFAVNSSAFIKKEDLKTLKTLNFETLEGIETIQTLDEDDSSERSLLQKPSSVKMMIENSMYQIISEDMINMFASISDYAATFAEPANKYERNYKNLDKLRAKFFERILNKPDLEKYIEFYKWLDSSLGYMLDQIKPESATDSSGLKITVESHMLERNKVQHKIPLTISHNNTYEAAVTRSPIVEIGSSLKPNSDILGHTFKGEFNGTLSSVSTETLGSMVELEAKPYMSVQTAGKMLNHVGNESNKNVFVNKFSSADGLSELNRDSNTADEMSEYNSLLLKSKDVRDDYNIAQSHLTGTQGRNLFDLQYSVQVISTIRPSLTKEVSMFITGKYKIISNDTVLVPGDIYDYTYNSPIGVIVCTAGLKTIKEVNFFSNITNIKFDDLAGPEFSQNLSSAEEITCEYTSSESDFEDNCFIQRNIPYTASNYAHTSSVDYVAIPNELVLAQRAANTITASNVGYREPPIEWVVPMQHNIKVAGANESIEIASPYSTVTHDFANFGLTNKLKGVNTSPDTDTLYRKVNNLTASAATINRIEHLENVFPPRTLMGLQEMRSKPGYDEVSGSFTGGAWSDDSYNRNTALINSFWRTNEADRRRTRGMDNPTSYIGSFNCLGEFNKSETSSGILTDRTGSVTGSQYKVGDYYIKLQVKYTTNRYDSIYSMDSIDSKTYSS
jgi:hypothetical protein